MRFIKTCCFIILIYAALVHTAQASASAILRDVTPVEQSCTHDKKPKTKERKKVIIQISKDVGFVLLTILEIVIESYEYNPGSCAGHRK